MLNVYATRFDITEFFIFGMNYLVETTEVNKAKI